jgi:hypothetical protein
MKRKFFQLSLVVLILSSISVVSYSDFESFVGKKFWFPNQIVLNDWVKGSKGTIFVAYEKYNRMGQMVETDNQLFKTIWFGQVVIYSCKENYYSDSSFSNNVGYRCYDINGNITENFGIITEFPQKVFDEHREMLKTDVKVDLRTNSAAYTPQDKLDLALDFENKGFDFTCDIYIAILTPEGQLFFYPGYYSLTPIPVLSKVLISSGFKFTMEIYNGLSLPSDNPPIKTYGRYEFIIALFDSSSNTLISNTIDRARFVFDSDK